MTISKTCFLILTAAALAALVCVLDARWRTQPVQRQQASQRAMISAPGRVAGAAEPVRLRFPLAGQVLEVLVSDGEQVQEGEVLLRIDPQHFLREYEQAAAELEAASGQLRLLKEGTPQQERDHAQALYEAQAAELTQVAAAFSRIRDLRSVDVATQQEFDNQRALLAVTQAKAAAAKAHWELLKSPPRQEELQVALSQVNAARARLELARSRLAQTQLTAPQAAQVLRVNVNRGELTGPQSSQPAIVLADTRRLSIRAFVDEQLAPQVVPGMQAAVTIDGLPGRKLRGRVARVSPSVGPKQMWTGEPGERFDSDVREVWIELEDDAGLVLGLRADVLLEPAAAQRKVAHKSRTPSAKRPAPTVPDTSSAIAPVQAIAPAPDDLRSAAGHSTSQPHR